jgi:hypothetical protein
MTEGVTTPLMSVADSKAAGDVALWLGFVDIALFILLLFLSPLFRIITILGIVVCGATALLRKISKMVDR